MVELILSKPEPERKSCVLVVSRLGAFTQQLIQLIINYACFSKISQLLIVPNSSFRFLCENTICINVNGKATDSSLYFEHVVSSHSRELEEEGSE